MQILCTTPPVPSDAPVTLLALHGEVDRDRAELLRDCLAYGVQQNTDVLVDLADVALLDCASLGALVEAGHLAERRGHRLCLTSPRPLVRRTLAATGLDTVFPVYQDCRRALAELTPRVPVAA
ncbi:STAS domain-containing protein [Actinoplanes sp. N902-109]|uniref:STAS domain-containing protein n=1 Tax=Actinoplanes sp. (strain N902-109) TaxID=649831 RepID=UPI00032945C7|nr:STAS domain-containing protein [Actinoplanes sp. N902-109]AGL16281.1 sulfate transporter/antisigma-factor antagonist STAS [Actinoplanes sp. N902-109]